MLPPTSMTMELRIMSFRPQLDGSAYGPCSEQSQNHFQHSRATGFALPSI
jgi:hypothetical protein